MLRLIRLTAAWTAIGLTVLLWAGPAGAANYPDREVWIFGWGLRSDREVAEISPVLKTASRHQLNGRSSPLVWIHCARRHRTTSAGWKRSRECASRTNWS